MSAPATTSHPRLTAILQFQSGSFATGFQGTLRILENEQQKGKEQGFTLPPAPDLPDCYQRWEKAYQSSGRKIIVPPGQSTYSSGLPPEDAKRQLESQMNQWFAQHGFLDLGAHIRFALSGGVYAARPIAIYSQTGDLESDRLLRKLPWHLWSLFQNLENAEAIVMSHFSPPVSPFGSQIRMLAVFGSDEGGLDLDQDLEILSGPLKGLGGIVLPVNGLDRFQQGIARGQFKDARYLLLPVYHQSLETLNNLLYQYPWDILFFAGHSSSDPSCCDGSLEIRPGDSVPIEAFRETLVQSVRQGLKLAIFNSCDGLGLADFLTKLQVPNVIAMREPVPDRVAHHFLANFLDEFLQGKPLTAAVHHARRRLQSLEYSQPPCPGASWLPILVKNPNQPDLIWPFEDDVRQAKPDPSDAKGQWPVRRLLWGGLGLVGSGALVVGTTLWSQGRLFPGPTSGQSPATTIYPPGHFKTFAEAVTCPEGEVLFGGSTTWAPIETTVLPQIKKAVPCFQFKKLDAPKTIIPGSSFGLEMLNQKKVAFAHVSRVPGSIPPTLRAHSIAYTFKAIAVHPDLDLQGKGLTHNQIKKICDGEILNWDQVGGPDLPITIIDRPSQTLLGKLEGSLGDSCKVSQTTDIRTTSAAIAKVAETPGSLMIAAANLLIPQCSLQILPVTNDEGKVVFPYKQSNLPCNQVPRQVNIEVFRDGSYLGTVLRDVLYVYVNEADPKSLEAGGSYINALLSCEGQRLIETAGYLRFDQSAACPATYL